MNSAGVNILILFIGFVLGILFYAKVIDKPETVNNTKIDNLKNKGNSNSIDILPPTATPKNKITRRRIFGGLKKQKK